MGELAEKIIILILPKLQCQSPRAQLNNYVLLSPIISVTSFFNSNDIALNFNPPAASLFRKTTKILHLELFFSIATTQNLFFVFATDLYHNSDGRFWLSSTICICSLTVSDILLLIKTHKFGYLCNNIDNKQKF